MALMKPPGTGEKRWHQDQAHARTVHASHPRSRCSASACTPTHTTHKHRASIPDIIEVVVDVLADVGCLWPTPKPSQKHMTAFIHIVSNQPFTPDDAYATLRDLRAAIHARRRAQAFMKCVNRDTNRNSKNVSNANKGPKHVNHEHQLHPALSLALVTQLVLLVAQLVLIPKPNT